MWNKRKVLVKGKRKSSVKQCDTRRLHLVTNSFSSWKMKERQRGFSPLLRFVYRMFFFFQTDLLCDEQGIVRLNHKHIKDRELDFLLQRIPFSGALGQKESTSKRAPLTARRTLYPLIATLYAMQIKNSVMLENNHFLLSLCLCLFKKKRSLGNS